MREPESREAPCECSDSEITLEKSLCGVLPIRRQAQQVSSSLYKAGNDCDASKLDFRRPGSSVKAEQTRCPRVASSVCQFAGARASRAVCAREAAIRKCLEQRAWDAYQRVGFGLDFTGNGADSYLFDDTCGNRKT